MTYIIKKKSTGEFLTEENDRLLWGNLISDAFCFSTFSRAMHIKSMLGIECEIINLEV